MRVGPWELLDRRYKLKKFAGQGLTTIVADGRSTVLYRGDWSIPKGLRVKPLGDASGGFSKFELEAGV